MNRESDYSPLIGHRSGNGLPNPPRRVRRKGESHKRVEVINRLQKADEPLLTEVYQLRVPTLHVPLRNRQAEPRLRRRKFRGRHARFFYEFRRVGGRKDFNRLNGGKEFAALGQMYIRLSSTNDGFRTHGRLLCL